MSKDKGNRIVIEEMEKVNDMTIGDIIKACENVNDEDDVMILFHAIDNDSEIEDIMHRTKTAREWIQSDISKEVFDSITFKVIDGYLIVKVRCYNLLS